MPSQPDLPVVGKVELAYRKWASENPAAMTLIREMSQRVLDRGKKASFWLIVNRVRWEVEFQWTSIDGFKINNNHIALIARQMIEEMPGLAPLIALRPMRGRRAN